MERLLIPTRYVVRLGVLVVLGLTLALVTGSGALAAPGTSISVAPKAFVSFFGFLLETQVTVQCSGGLGDISGTVTQTAADSGNGVGATGSTFGETANCDGTSHKVAVTFIPDTSAFNIGKATASMTLFTPSGTATDTRTIQIIAG
jgi:hypothetical protein